MRLTDEELRDVPARAEEIERATRQGDEWDADVAAVVGAAEEIGLSPQAVKRAMTERLNLPAIPVAGSLAWARSADAKFYAAEVLFNDNVWLTDVSRACPSEVIHAAHNTMKLASDLKKLAALAMVGIRLQLS